MNEPLHAHILQDAIGDSINWYVFKWAHVAAPKVKLYVNEYNVEWGTGANDYKALIKKMISKGAPIDGIGVQSHLYIHPNPAYGNFLQNGDSNYDINIPDFKKNMDTLATLGLPIKFTEFDLDTTNQLKQALNYARMFRFAFSYPACSGIICWSLTEPAWQASIGGMFDAKRHPKLVMDTVYNLLHNIWTTKITDQTKSDGSYKFKGYYGNYEIKVKVGNTWKLFKAQYLKANSDSLYVFKENEGLAVRPKLLSVQIIKRNQIEVKFDKPMSDPNANTHSFMIFGDLSTGIDSSKIKQGDSTVIVLYLNKQVQSGYFLSLAYNKGSQTSSDGGELENFGPDVLVNPYPSVTSAVTSKDGKTIYVKFTRPMIDPSAQVVDFSIATGHIINSIVLQSGNDSIMVVSLKDSIVYGEKPTITYTTGTITSTDSFALDPFTKYAIGNMVSKPLSIASLMNYNIKVFPNPATNSVMVTGTSNFDEIIITNMMGQTLKVLKTDATVETVDISGLPNSTYILSVKSGNLVVSKSMLIKIR